MTKVKKIPRFESLKEEARFWDTHDITDYLGEMKEVTIKFEPALIKKEVLTLRIPSKLKKHLAKIAESYGINLSTLARIWLIDKLKQSEGSKVAF